MLQIAFLDSVCLRVRLPFTVLMRGHAFARVDETHIDS